MAKETGECPCGSGHLFSDCCQPLLAGSKTATTAEALMRSRYSAFATRNVDYLLKTSAPELQASDERVQLEAYCASVKWLALHVLSSETHASTGNVEFAAFFERDGQLEQLHELSQFEKRDGQWIYTTGEFLPPLKFGRNDSCWCHSGKKLKKRHSQ